MVDFDFIRVHLLWPAACVCASACSRYAARRITSRMPPAAWSGQWASNADGHQSDLYLFLSSKHLMLCRDNVTATVIPTAKVPLWTVRNGRQSGRKRIGATNVYTRKTAGSGFRAVAKFGLSVCNRRKVSIGLLVLGVVVLMLADHSEISRARALSSSLMSFGSRETTHCDTSIRPYFLHHVAAALDRLLHLHERQR